MDRSPVDLFVVKKIWPLEAKGSHVQNTSVTRGAWGEEGNTNIPERLVSPLHNTEHVTAYPVIEASGNLDTPIVRRQEITSGTTCSCGSASIRLPSASAVSKSSFPSSFPAILRAN